MAAILVVDPNEAFATLLVEELQQQAHEVISAPTYDDAIAATDATDFDLALLDMAVNGQGSVALARELRERQQEIRLMFIPMLGEDLPDEVREAVSVQGVLPKPFFLPELPERIEEALAAPIAATGEPVVDEPPAKTPPTAPPSSQLAEVSIGESAVTAKIVAQHRDGIERVMADLAQEVGANVVLLCVGDKMTAAVGQLDETETRAMAQVVGQSWATSSEVGRILGREQVRFEQSISGGDYVLYALSIDGPAILAVAIQGTAMLGLLRHRARETAEAIATLCLA